jgi:anaerobic magnesium-protoporphyrin IX monomethyl ester cyclase
VKRFGTRHVGFVDPIFPLDKKHAIETCRAIRAKNISKTWWWTCETRVDIVDEEMCQEMKLARCKRILFGIESGVNEILAGVGKNYTTDDVRRGVAAARAAGLEISAFFMIGLPGETKETAKQTIAFALSLDIDFAKFGITIPLPGSELYDDLVKQGKIVEKKWEKFTTFNPSPESLPYVPEGMTGEELVRLHRLANLKFYLRPKIIFRHLFVIRSIGWKAMFNGAMLILKQLLKDKK